MTDTVSDERKLRETHTFDIEVDADGDSPEGSDQDMAMMKYLDSLRSVRLKVTFEVYR